MNNSTYRLVDKVTRGILCEGSKKKVTDYFGQISILSPIVAVDCVVLVLDAETGRWSKEVA